MFLKGTIRLRKGANRFLKTGHPWVYSNELVKIDTTLAPGSWVSLEAPDGRALGYGHFNPRSLIAFRIFERAAFTNEDRVRALLFARLDRALLARRRAYGDRIEAGEMGASSMRLCFGESDGAPGLIVDLYERGVAVVQCHSAGADGFVEWTRQWLEEKLGIKAGVLRNDLDVRRREGVELQTSEWGNVPADVHALEGGVRFFVDPRRGQKTGYFYDHRDNRAELARRGARVEGDILDCFSYVGGWGLQALKRNKKARLVAIDVSGAALGALKRNAQEAGLAARVETIEADFFGDKNATGSRKFGVVVSDPPSLTSSAKQAAEGKRAHEACFKRGLAALAPGGLAALASCSFHLEWDAFFEAAARAGGALGRQLRITFVGGQGADHPVLATSPETRYLKCAFVEDLE